MKIDTSSSQFSAEEIKRMEEHFNAKYICETSIKDRNENWINIPVAVFWQDKAHPQGSNYFGIFFGHMNQLMICDAISATLESFTGAVNGDEVIYSRYRHDYRQGNGFAIDGGRDYVKIVGDVNVKLVQLQIVKDKLIMIGD